MELREQRRLDAFAGLVVRPEFVAKRFDDVVGGDADMRGALLEHLQHRLQYTDHGAVGLVLALVEAAQPIEVPVQLVGAVDDVDDHARLSRAHRAAVAQRCRGETRAGPYGQFFANRQAGVGSFDFRRRISSRISW